MPQRDTKFKIVSNHNFVRVNVGWLDTQGIDLLIKTLRNFEKNHSEIEVVTWNVKKFGQFVYGIDIHHRPRPVGR